MTDQATIGDLTVTDAPRQRSSTAAWAADQLRRWITERRLRPGDQLPEKALAERLDVSRNTLREAFRLLEHERLLEHRLHHGMFVREPSVDDVRDLYRVRRLIEPGTIRQAADAGPAALDAVRAAVQAGEQAAARADWAAVGVANMRFHRAVAGLAGSRWLDAVMGRLLAELALVFSIEHELRAFHEPYLATNREITDLIGAGRLDDAAARLLTYLDDAERQLVADFAPHRGG